MIIYRRIFILSILAILFLLAACVPSLSNINIPGLTRPSVTPTDCGCSIDGPARPTPTGGLGLAGPAAPGPEPTKDLSGLKDIWPVYSHSESGISFEYPAVYNSPDYQSCAARQVPSPVSQDPNQASISLALGSRTELRVFPTGGKSLDELAKAYLSDPANKDVQFDPAQQRTVGPDAIPAITLPFRSGGTNHFGEVTLFVRGDSLYRVSTGTPSACDVPAINLTEMNAYTRLLASIK